MTALANLLIALVALLHAGFLILEMFLWSTPVGRKVFGLPPDVMAAAAPLAANQGLYNGFLAAGLVWGLVLGPGGFSIKLFFLSCVVVAGLYGGLTTKRSILALQALPGLLALASVLASRG